MRGYITRCSAHERIECTLEGGTTANLLAIDFRRTRILDGFRLF
jgi:hypothetical protein